MSNSRISSTSTVKGKSASKRARTSEKSRLKDVAESSGKSGNGKPKVTSRKTVAPSSPLKIEIPEINLSIIEIEIEGLSGLIMNKWSEKAKQEMRDKQFGKAIQKKQPKDPKANYEDSMYVIGDKPKKYGFPSIAFKNAAVSACSQVSGITKVFARGAFHVIGEYVEIKGKPRMREDMVRLQGTTADIRYRAEFPEWKATVKVSYNADVITPEQIVNLFNLAGFSYGIGEWRPERNGAFGRFQVALK